MRSAQFRFAALHFGQVVLDCDIVGNLSTRVAHRCDAQLVPGLRAVRVDVMQQGAGGQPLAQRIAHGSVSRITTPLAFKQQTPKQFDCPLALHRPEGRVGIHDRTVR